MLRILIPSDNQDFIVHWARAYARYGCEIVVGRFNFDLRTSTHDLVHVQWPEELSCWSRPSRECLQSLFMSLDHWNAQAKVLLTVHNFYPHGCEGDPTYHELYDGFYRRASVVHHFSNASRELVCAEFPGARERCHIVTAPFNYDLLLPPTRDRDIARREYGLADRDIAVLVFGALRTWAEVKLIRQAFTGAKVKHKRLIMAGRYQERQPRSVWTQRYRRQSWGTWLKRQRAVEINGYVPDDQVHRVFDAADIVVVPRLKDLSSGIPSMAMTFGKLVIAPRHGAFPDYLAGSRNLLYDSGDAVSLAQAIEKASTLDRDVIGLENRRIADNWNWDKIVAQCLDACFRDVASAD